MPTHRLNQTIDRPIADVLATVSDMTTFPSWNPTTVSATKITEGDIGNGTRFQMKIRGFGDQVIELSELEESKRVRLEPKSRMFGGGHRFTLSDEGDRTRVDHVLEMNPKGIFMLMWPIAWLMSKRSLSQTAQGLQDHLESRGYEAASSDA